MPIHGNEFFLSFAAYTKIEHVLQTKDLFRRIVTKGQWRRRFLVTIGDDLVTILRSIPGERPSRRASPATRQAPRTRAALSRLCGEPTFEAIARITIKR
jgi:hypothetical protein